MSRCTLPRVLRRKGTGESGSERRRGRGRFGTVLFFRSRKRIADALDTHEQPEFLSSGHQADHVLSLYRFLVVTLHSTERDSRINCLEIKFRILGVREFSRQRRSREIDTSSECFHSSPWL